MGQDLAGRIRQVRREGGFTQAEFGAVLGVSDSTVGSWETGARTPDADMLEHVADKTGTSVDWLLGRTPLREGLRPPTPEELEKYPTLKAALVRHLAGPPADLAALPAIMRASGFSEDDITTVMKVVRAFQPTKEGQADK